MMVMAPVSLTGSRVVVGGFPTKGAFVSLAPRGRSYLDWKRERVVEDPAIMAGAPCFAGTRVPVAHVGGLIRDGLIEEVREDFPQLTEDDLAWSPSWLAANAAR